ncbi:DUF1800 domain-containing protein [Ponticaulis koreensis]|uniref:DUF1800 domain-containing protein n=1 Tax=Ponticaulis koreensis TaxID=1123045 RepID=UPI0003B3CE86|nr:DUF1800 domain-containing protein [Ponticaulis koreensis]
MGRLKKVLITGAASLMLLAACSGGGGGDNSNGTPTPTPTPVPSPPPPPPPPPAPPPVQDTVFETRESTARFLTHATFGPRTAEIDTLTGKSASDWFQAQLNLPPTLNLPYIDNYLDNDPNGRTANGAISFSGTFAPVFAFWNNSITAEDQLRQRVTFALSEIFVISTRANVRLRSDPIVVGAYMDILTRNALGNFRDLLDEVTYSPAMGEFLTYLQNQRGDPDTGRMPDENYAREVMQLFTIGLIELNNDGTPRLDGNGQPIETYTNDDVTGLARVFTGLSKDTDSFFDRPIPELASRVPMRLFPEFHSNREKNFLGVSIPAGTGGEESIDTALDTLFDHPNVGPFIGRQLIQRLVTSHPDPDYIARVATAFNQGSYVLPDGDLVGTGERGDLAATVAAVLMDEDATGDQSLFDDEFGKVREPILRFTHWARAFDAEPVSPQGLTNLWIPTNQNTLGVAAYSAPSVFNFFRPGYVAPGTESGEAGLTVPELQIFNAGTIPTVANFMGFFINEVPAQFAEPERNVFLPDYDELIELADNEEDLVDYLDTYLTFGTMSEGTRQSIIDQLALIDPEVREFRDGQRLRVRLAVFLTLSSTDYLLQR